jgi:hexosaminidase
MKNYILFIFLILIKFLSAQNTPDNLSIIPRPQDLVILEGTFKFSPQTKIVLDDQSIKTDIEWFNDYLQQYYGYKLEIVPVLPATGNYLVFAKPGLETGQKEKYTLDIAPYRISILAESNSSGFFYGLQSLVQLLPAPENKSLKKATQTTFEINCLRINDEPRFKWRGMHLDVCRHFFPVSFIKRYIDLIAQYKMNVFHWHLTEDQGWRIEIKKYPELTNTGAWRSGTMVGKYTDKKYDKIRYGGFYTQEEIKEVIAYAEKRHITIVPEIEMPGHSLAAIAAYPWLSCSGKKQEVAKGWGVFDDVYCTKDSTFNFLQNVLDEIISLFPGKYIHIGGDECPKTRWKTCSNCQSLIKKENLKDENELQSYFIRRIEKYLNSKGKQIIGWDEILEGGLAPNAAVMSWRGTEGGIAAAKQKHSVIMSPGKPCYFDHYQVKDRSKEPLAIGGCNTLDSVYNYEPSPNLLNAREKNFILGSQGNVWTEYILTEKQVEYMAVPRMCALAEVLWTQKEKKNYKDFQTRLKLHSKMLNAQQVNYARHFLNK